MSTPFSTAVSVCLRCICLLALGWGWGSSAFAQPAPAAVVKVVPSGQPVLTSPHQPIFALPPSGPASATLSASGLRFSPTTYGWSQVSPVLVKEQHLHAAQAAITFSATSGAQVTASFPVRGVYQLLLTASNGSITATTPVWIHVWDRLDGLNPLKEIGRNPGLLPPSSVRQLTPDPGPYQHPRLLFTDDDWPELNAKITASSEVGSALSRLQSALNNNFDKTTPTVGNLRLYANALSAWASGGFLDATYSASVEPTRIFSERKKLGADPNNQLPDALLVAAYLVWVRNNPALPASVSPADQSRLRFLSQVAAATGRAELTRVRLGLATTVVGAPDMAVVYDLLYDWMTPAERTDLRDYLFTIGYGYFNTGGGGLERRSTAPSYIANGDFPNLVDPWILAALAIEGEEADVTPAVIAANTPVVPAATGPGAWPNASPASVWNLYRMMRWYSEFFVTPWGSPLHHHAYFEASSGMSGPAMLALARRGQNGFVTSNLYQASFHVFNNLNPESPTTPPVLWDHHDGMGFGNGIGGYAGRYLARYMFPDDALMDSVYPTFRREVSVDFYTVLFHIDRPAKTMAQVAAEKGFSLTHLDPFRGAATTRNTWGENDLSLYFESRPDIQGHMHAEANNFSLYALGRPWSTPPGYHVTINDAAATVLIQDPALASDPATQGYLGQSPSAATITPARNQFPTPSGKVVEATEDPAGRWTLFAGDAFAAYNYAFEGGMPSTLDTGKRTRDFYYGEVLSEMNPDYNSSTDTATLKVGNLAYNPVTHAFRTVFSARGSRPYVLVVDDITVDGTTPRNYRWNLPAFGRDAVNTLRLQSGATATDAVLFHQPDAASGPRLLVRDLSEQSTAGQPAIIQDRRVNGDGQPQLDIGYDNNSGLYTSVQSNRLLITRQNVVSPKFKVLLFPHQSNENLPLTSWNAEKTIASIDLRDGFTDQITFDSTRADQRTRIAAYTRTQSGRVAPTLNFPANLTVSASSTTPAFNGQPGAIATFAVSATDDTGAALTPAISSPSGTIFPIGVNPVFVTATDSNGQITSRQFTVTVVPAAPTVSVTSVTNLPGGASGITLGWRAFAGATAYSVKRATSPGGPYTVVSDRQTTPSFTDSGLAGTGFYYIVTAWLDDLEGPPSAELALAGDAAPFIGRLIDTPTAGYGFYRQGGSYLLTFTGGQIGSYSDQTSFVSIPWTGDGTFTTRLVSVIGEGGSVSQFGSYGIVLRQNTTANGLMAAASYNTFVNPLAMTWRPTAGALASSAGPFSRVSIPCPIWLRLVRAGSTVTAFYSNNGQTWTQTAAPATVNFSGPTLVGLAGGGQNTTLTSVVFDNVVFVGPPRCAVQPGGIALTWDASPSLVYSVQRATSESGPFQTIATGLTSPAFIDTAVATGGTYYYTVTTSGPLGGETVTPAVSVFYPSPVVAPTGLVLTPALGQITLTWDAGPTDTVPTYFVQRATSPAGPFVTVATGLTTPTYVDTGASFANGTTYFYRVVADNGLGPASSATSSATSTAGTFIKANNTIALDSGLSWSPTAVPGLADNALWTGTYASGTVGIGAGLSVNQLQLTSPSQAITLSAGTGPLTLGAGGLDLSTATQNLTVNAPIVLTANQSWNVNSSRTATVNAAITESGGVRTLIKAGAGNLVLAGANGFSGGLNLTAGTVTFGGSGVVDATGLTAASATGTVTYTNTSPTGNSLSFAGGSSFARFTPGGAAVTLTNSGPVAFGVYGYNTASTWTTTFSGGTWTFGNAGVNSSNSQNNGTTVITNGAIVSFTSGRYGGHGTWKVGGVGGPGTLAFPGLTMENGSSLPFNLTVDNSGTYTGTATILSFNQAITTAQSNSISVNAGGSITLSGNLQIGGTTAMGANGSESNTLNLNGGKLAINGNLFASTALASTTKTFNWIGGQLTATTLTAGAGFATPAAGGLTTTGLVQTGGTLAPGDLGTAGRTTITGNYTLGAGGTLALDIGGTTAATAYQNNTYDTVVVTGTTALSGTLSVRLINGFTPSNVTSFTVMTSGSAATGGFGNVAFNQRLATTGSEGSFLVTQSGNTLVLSQYLNALASWRLANFGTSANTGTAADSADFDLDGVANLMEYALDTTPTSAASRPNLEPQISNQRLQITFFRARPDVTYIVEASSVLSPDSWTTLATNPGSVGQPVTVIDTVEIPAADPPRRFLRLRVTSL